MQLSVQIRDCESGQDVEAIRQILNHEITYSTSIYEDQTRSQEQTETWFAAKRAGRWPLRGAYCERGQLLGFATFAPFRPQAAYRFTVEHSVYVAPQARGQGVGQLLLCDLIEQANARRYRVLVGCIDATNLASLALHQKLGFTHCGTVKQAGYKFDRWLDVTFMQKVL